MKYEKMHRSYRHVVGGKAVPSDKLINDLGDDAIYYIGTFSEYNPIGIKNNLAVFVKKEWNGTNQKRDFKLKGYEQKSAGGYCGAKNNYNVSLKFSKEQLLRIANAMDDSDNLVIAKMDSIDRGQFLMDIDLITK